MNEEALRAIVREAVARQLGRPPDAPPPGPQWKGHASHHRFVLVTGRDEDGPCLIEPTVRCTHCAYCQSYGH